MIERLCARRGGGGGAALGAALVALAAGTGATPALARPEPGFSDRAAAKGAFLEAQAARDVRPRWTGSVAKCRVGTESPQSLDATLRTVNILRAFAGLKPVTFSAEKNHKALAAALMMLAAGRLNHHPGRKWPCYSEDGLEGASNSNLYLGESGAAAMIGYVRDEGVASLGHRLWLLDPGATEFGSGSTPGSNALYVFDSRSTPVPSGSVSAWPAPGWFPWPWVFRDWSVTVGSRSDRVSFKNAKVKVTIDGERANVRKQRPLSGSYGTGGALTWRVALPKRARKRDRQIDVRISGVTVNGSPRPISYSINAFTPPRDAWGHLDFDRERVCIDTRNPAPTKVEIARRDGPVERTMNVPANRCRAHRLGAGYWRFCASQGETNAYLGWSMCKQRAVRGRARLKFGRARAKGGRVAFPLTAGEPLVGRRAKLVIRRFKHGCYWWRPPVPGAQRVRACGLLPAGKRTRRVTLKRTQTIAVGKPRKRGAVKLRLRVAPFEHAGAPYRSAKASARYRRR